MTPSIGQEVVVKSGTLVRIALDGRRLEVEPGTSILEAARAAGVPIPSLCYDPRLVPVDRCGLCVVDVKGQGLVHACQTTAAEGMEVLTTTPEIKEARRARLNEYLTKHNAYCEPPCHYACPAGIDIPAYTSAIARGDDSEAVRIVKERLPLPRVIGRICPHPCESSCRRAQVDGEPVAICQLKRFAADRVSADDGSSDTASTAGERLMGSAPATVARPTGKSVAVVGSGPSGLSAAYYLASAGHRVTIFEADSEPGGMLRTGIPRYRLPREVIAEEVDDILRLGIELKLGARLGRDFTLDELRADGYDAVYVAIGAQSAFTGGIPGIDGESVYTALDFLRRANEGTWDKPLGRTLVIGGGNVAFDCARVALRLGAAEVKLRCIEGARDLPAAPEEAAAGQAEGVQVGLRVWPIRVIRKDGNVTGVLAQGVELGELDRFGRRQPRPILDDTFFIPADTVILAIGQTVESRCLEDVCDLSPRGAIQVDRLTLETSRQGVFAGGDCTTGTTTVVEAIAAGRRAAVAIDAYVRGEDTYDACADPAAGLERPDPRLFDIGAKPLSDDPRSHVPELPLTQRSGFAEIELGFDEVSARSEAARCMQCSCHAATTCRLRELCIEYGAGSREFAGEQGQFELFDGRPILELDRKRCIQCHNCVRICDECEQYHVYKVDEGGYPALNGDKYRDAGCVSCGQCTDVCPTGALVNVQLKGARRWEVKQVRTTCPFCGTGCNFDLNVKDGRVVGVTTAADAPVNGQELCVKGRFATDIIHSRDRLTVPLIRKNGVLVESTWDEALDLVAERLTETRDRYGAGAFGALSSARCTNEENWVMQKFVRVVMRTNNLDHCART